jgi:hypothetical protein
VLIPTNTSELQTLTCAWRGDPVQSDADVFTPCYGECCHGLAIALMKKR